MKQFLVLCLLIMSLTSCSVSDDSNDSYNYDFLPIESVDMPEQFVHGETYEINLSYIRPTGCHVFNNIYYQPNQNQANIAIINTVYTNQDCQQDLNELVDVSFNFKANSYDNYVFRFWQGEDENGNDIYYIVEVPVVE
ncbi:hypothetical protein [Lacinutrix undariae]